MDNVSKRTAIALGLVLGANALLGESAMAAGAGRRFVANFVYPYTTLEPNKRMFRAMNTDAITFGGWLRDPKPADGIPWEILRYANRRRVLFYTEPLTWYRGMGSDHKWVYANSTADGKRYAWDIVSAGGAVVISKNTGTHEKVRHLIQAGRETGYRTYVGLPKPQMQTESTWLPDTGYLGIYQAFCEKFVVNYNALGASGFYHTLEMTISDKFDPWRPTWNTYWAGQRAIRNMSGHGKTSIFSPYLEARSTKGSRKTPSQVAYGARWFNDLTYGTNLVISPQDGLGTGSTALRADRASGYIARTEDYYQALKPVLGNKLYATTECMTPGGGQPHNRGITSKGRIEQQLNATGPYVQGNIGYMWNHPTAGMTKVPNLGSAYSAGTGRLG